MSGNGADLGHVVSMLADVLAGQQGLQRQIIMLDAKVTALDVKVNALDAKLTTLERKVVGLDVDVKGLRLAVTDYHASVLGHGILISELDTRLRRVELHLHLSPAA